MNDAQRSRFERAYAAYGAMLYRIAVVSVCRKAEAEDCVSETFLRYMRLGSAFGSADHEKAWLIRVCINVCKNFNKRAFNRKTTELPDAIAAGERGFDRVEVRDMLSRLPRKTNLALYLKFYEGLTSAEIGKAMGMSAGGVRSLIARAERVLRLTLNEPQGDA